MMIMKDQTIADFSNKLYTHWNSSQWDITLISQLKHLLLLHYISDPNIVLLLLLHYNYLQTLVTSHFTDTIIVVMVYIYNVYYSQLYYNRHRYKYNFLLNAGALVYLLSLWEYRGSLDIRSSACTIRCLIACISNFTIRAYAPSVISIKHYNHKT